MKKAVRFHTVCVSSSNDRESVSKTFAPLHYTCRHFRPSHLDFVQLHFTALHYPLIRANYKNFRKVAIEEMQICLCAVLLWWTDCNWCVYVQCCCGGQTVTGVFMCSAAVVDRM